MKKFNSLRSTFAVLSLAFLGACSTSQYTFAPNTGGYHGSERSKTEVVVAENMAQTEASADASLNNEPAALAPAHAQVSAALAQAKTENSAAQVTKQADATDKKAARQALKQAKAKLKQIKKDIKDGKGDQGLGLNNNVKLL